MNAIECKKLNKSFGSKIVLDDIDLLVEEGEFFALVGMNGSGKSTMIKVILDLVSINSGRVEIFSQSHRGVNSRNNVAYFPDRFNPPPHLTGRDFINYMLELHGSKKSNDDINKILDALELGRKAIQESVSQLSKGMTQKLGLASCLLSDKSLLILDEPMSGLDPKARVLLKKQLSLLKEQGKTLFFSSHVLTDVEEIADRMAVLHETKILYTGTTENFKQTYKGKDVEDAYMKCVGKTKVN
jgi:ABC-2 type transport system ATP-binding protein